MRLVSTLVILALMLVASGSTNSKISDLVFPDSLLDVDVTVYKPTSMKDKLGLRLAGLKRRFTGQPVVETTLVAEAPNPMHARPRSTASKLLGRISFFKGGGGAKKKLLVLMSDTGGGHRASAQALDQALQDQYPGKIDVQIMDIWTDHAGWPYNNFVPMYRYLAKHPLLWRGFYIYGMFPPTKLYTEIDSKRTSYKKFRKAIEDADPDFVVSMHPLCQLMPISIVKEMNAKRASDRPRIPFVTIVTDLGSAHSTWFDRRADAVFVPSEEVLKIALAQGMPSGKILLKGLPIRPSFWKAALPKNTIRKTLGIPERVKTVLLMGGGDGVGKLGKIAVEVANNLQKLDMKSQLIVICGHNKKMTEKLSEKLKSTASMEVMIKGFVNNVDEFMTSSDLLITKAGPGTIAESMIRGLPLVISSYLPGQVYIYADIAF
jgi:1,2-diacylglycerol 3-beta-galactosyltransferase